MPQFSLRSPRAILQEVSALWRLAWPIMVAQLAQTGHAFVDVVMAGHYGSTDLAAVSVGASVWVTLMVSVMGLMLALSPLVAQAFGARSYGRIAPITQQAIWQALWLSALVWLVSRLAESVFLHLELTPEVASKAAGFLRGICLGLPAFAVYRALYGYSASVNQTKPIMVIAVLGLLLNIPFNYVLIYGKLGLPELGGVGCGYASAIDLWLTCAIMLAWLLWSPRYRDFRLFARFEPLRWVEQKQLLKLGLPIGLMFFIEVSAFAIVALLVGRFGVVQVAAHQVTLNFSSLVFMIPSSLATAVTVRVGQALGAQQWRQARFVSWVGVGLGLLVAMVSALSIVLFARQIAGVYTQDEAVIALVSQLLLFAAVFQLSDATQVNTAGALRAYKVTRLPMVIHMTAFWGVGLPLGVALGLAPGWLPFAPAQPWAAKGFWLGLVVSLTIAAALLAALLARVTRRSE